LEKLIAQRFAETKRKNNFTFWLIFGLNLNLGLNSSLSERLIPKVKLPIVSFVVLFCQQRPRRCLTYEKKKKQD